jgi:hypothetical protein
MSVYSTTVEKTDFCLKQALRLLALVHLSACVSAARLEMPGKPQKLNPPCK